MTLRTFQKTVKVTKCEIFKLYLQQAEILWYIQSSQKLKNFHIIPQGSGDVSGETEMQLGNEWYGVVDIHRD